MSDRRKDSDRDRNRDKDRKRDSGRDDSRRSDRDRDQDRSRSDRDSKRPRDDSRRKRTKSKSRSPESKVPRAKTPPLGGSGGFFVRGGVQKSMMKKSDNIDDHVFMPGEKIGDAFMIEEEPSENIEQGKTGGTAQDRDMRDIQRAEGGDDYQKKMLEAAHTFYGTEARMEIKMTANRIQSGYKAGGGIRANEIKGFLNIWCNQRRLKPEYEFIERGKPPKGTFICKLSIDGFDYVAETEARTKREAQADAAWDYANKLCAMGYCNQSDLPNKTMATVNTQGCVPTEWKSVLTDDMIGDAGNWTPDNCRKRLSMFCNFEKISCEIVNSALGPDHAKIAISELKLTLKKYGKEFYAKEQARTKKLANSLVAWSIMKQLYQADMMEGFGERLKRAADSKFLKKEDLAKIAAEDAAVPAVGNDITVDTGMDTNTGDWTLDSSRTRLHEFFQQRGIEVEYMMQEIGFPPDRVYTALLAFEIDGKRYKSFYECENKKMTQKKTAFDIMVQLYHDKKVEPNSGRRNWGDGPTGNLLGGFAFPQAVIPPPQGHMMGPRDSAEFCVKAKLAQITPNPNFANVVNSTLVMIETCMKNVSDDLLGEKKLVPENMEKTDEELRDLLGVMRVGALSANTVLTNEAEFLLIMMMKEKPTINTLVNISKRLDQKVPHEHDYNFLVRPDVPMGGIEIIRDSDPGMIIFVKITSIKCKEAEENGLKTEFKGPVPMGKTEVKVESVTVKQEVKKEVKIEKKPEIKPEVIEIIPDDEEVKKENSDVKTEVKESKPEKPKQVPENGGVIEDDDVETGEIVDSPKPDTSKSNPQKPLVRPGTPPFMGTPPPRMGTPPFRHGAPPPFIGSPHRMGTPPYMGTPPPNMNTPPPHLGRMPQKLANDKFIDNDLCLQALAELRHSKWFQNCAMKMPNIIPVIRLCRDLCQRVRTWSILSDWQLNLLIQKSLESAVMPMLPSDGIRRMFSSVSGGVLLRDGLGIADPTEKDNTDALLNFSEQDREDLTASAQHALRLICFGEIHKIIGIHPPQQ